MADELELHALSRRSSDDVSDSESTLYSPRLTTSWGHDEAQLLSGSDEEAARPTKRATPLPKAQLAALCTVRLVDPIAFTQGAYQMTIVVAHKLTHLQCSRMLTR